MTKLPVPLYMLRRELEICRSLTIAQRQELRDLTGQVAAKTLDIERSLLRAEQLEQAIKKLEEE